LSSEVKDVLFCVNRYLARRVVLVNTVRLTGHSTVVTDRDDPVFSRKHRPDLKPGTGGPLCPQARGTHHQLVEPRSRSFWIHAGSSFGDRHGQKTHIGRLPSAADS